MLFFVLTGLLRYINLVVFFTSLALLFIIKSALVIREGLVEGSFYHYIYL